MVALVTAWVMVMVTPGVPAGLTCEDWEDARVAEWCVGLSTGSATAEERQQILDSLRQASRGRPRAPATREAIFALAHLLTPDDENRAGEALNAMRAAATLYPHDPRSVPVLRRLGLTQAGAGDVLGAHFSLTRLLQRQDAPDDPELLIRAAVNAIEVGDTASAVTWSSRVDAGTVEGELETRLWLVRLQAGEALGQHDDALEAVDRLDAASPETIRRNEGALLAAARTEASVGRTKRAALRYENFINIFTESASRPAAMLEHARLLSSLQRPDAATRSLDWLLEDHPGTPEADLARIVSVDLDDSVSTVRRALAYRNAAEQATTPVGATEACRRIQETLVSEGRPLDAVSILGSMARGDGLSALAARQTLTVGLEPAMDLLSSRGDLVGLAAVAAEAASLGLAWPTRLAEEIAESRARLGLAPLSPGPLKRALFDARAHAVAGQWDQIVVSLGPALQSNSNLSRTARAEPARLLAEAFWREDQPERALETIGGVLAPELREEERRRLLVLRADILASTGSTEAACTDYASAMVIAASPWVEAQSGRCEHLATLHEENGS